MFVSPVAEEGAARCSARRSSASATATCSAACASCADDGGAVKPAAFDYHRVDRVEDALERLAELGEDAKVLAGGQSLVPMMNFRLVRPPALVDITRIPDLRYVERDGDALRIGALTLPPRDRARSTTPTVVARLRAAAAGGALGRPLPDPHARHVRRLGRARRPVGRVVHARRAARRDGRRRAARTASARSRPRTSSSASSRPRSSRASCSSRCASRGRARTPRCRSSPAATATSRSSRRRSRSTLDGDRIARRARSSSAASTRCRCACRGGRAGARRRRAGRRGVRRGGPGRRRGGRPVGRHPRQRRVPQGADRACSSRARAAREGGGRRSDGATTAAVELGRPPDPPRRGPAPPDRARRRSSTTSAAPGLLALAFVRSPHGRRAHRRRSTPTPRSTSTACAPCSPPTTSATSSRSIPRLDRPEFVAVEMPLLARDRVRHVGEPRRDRGRRHAARRRGRRRARRRRRTSRRRRSTSIDAALADDAPRSTTRATSCSTSPSTTTASSTSRLDDAALVLEETFDSGAPDRAADGGPRLPGRVGRPRPAAHAVDLDAGPAPRPHDGRRRCCGCPSTACASSRPTSAAASGRSASSRARRRSSASRRGALGAPVKWVEDRRENLDAGFQGHEQRFDVAPASTPRAGCVGVAADILCDVGAYSTHPFTCGVEPLMAATELPGPTRSAATGPARGPSPRNKAPMAPYRGVSRPQMVLAMERLMQKAARAPRPRPGRDPPAQPDPARRVPVDRRRPASSSTRAATTRRSRPAPDDARHRRRSASGSAPRATEGRLLGIGFSCFAERTRLRDRGVQPAPDGRHAGLRHRARADGPDRRGDRRRRHLGPRPGPPDDARPDRRRPARRSTPGDRGAPGRHRRDAVRLGHVRQPLDGRRRRRTHARARARSPSGCAGSPRTCWRPRPEDVELRDGRADVARLARARPARIADLARLAYLEAQQLPDGEEPGPRGAARRSTRPARSRTRRTAASSRSTATPAR